MIQKNVGGDAAQGRDGKNEAGGGRGDVDGEIQQVDHEGDVDDAASHAEDAGKEANPHTGSDADLAVVAEILWEFQHVRVFCMGGVPVHDDCHASHEDAIVKVQHADGESVHDVGTEKGAGQGGKSKGNGGMEEDPLLSHIGQCSREGIGQDDDEGGAGNLGCRAEIGIDAPRRQEEDEHGHADESAADPHEGAKDANTGAHQKKQDEFHEETAFPKDNFIILYIQSINFEKDLSLI